MLQKSALMPVFCWKCPPSIRYGSRRG